jgi:hypothetical protein
LAIRHSPLVALVLALLPLAACGGGNDDPDDKCLDTLQTTCTPTFPPAWPAIYERILRPQCGVLNSGGTCHGAEGKQGGLNLVDANTAYSELLGMTGHARVIPNDPKCSILMKRLESTDPNYRMPRGGTLDAGFRCVIQQWIAAGASPQ